MYQITVYKMMYQTKQNKTYKNKIKITNYTIDKKNLTSKLIELKKIYKDFSYIIEFDKS